MSDAAQPEEHKGRLAAMQKASRLLREHFDIGFIVVSHEEAGTTRFALCKLADDYADGWVPWARSPDFTEAVDPEDENG